MRGKYVERYRSGTNLVLLESDVQAAFPDAESVNEVPANADESCPPTDAKTNLNVGNLLINCG